VGANVYLGVRLASRWTVAIALGFGLVLVGAGPASAGRLKPSWNHVADASGVLVSPRYVFVANPVGEDGSFTPGGALIDEQTGNKRSIVPLAESGLSCGQASAIGGSWLAFVCKLASRANQPAKNQIELYRIPTRQWRSVPDALGGPVLGVGADWIEIWVPEPNVPHPQFAFQNIFSGKTQTLAGWQPGGQVIPDLNSPSLGQRLCAPVRVPDVWYTNGEDWPGTVSFFGRYAVVGGTTRAEKAFGYLERCGTRMHRT
jgi:hypothetical protein